MMKDSIIIIPPRGMMASGLRDRCCTTHLPLPVRSFPDCGPCLLEASSLVARAVGAAPRSLRGQSMTDGPSVPHHA